MFPSEVEIQQHRVDMEREAANHRLAQIARGSDRPNLWSRLRGRINIAQPESQPAARPCKEIATT